jgi:UDPglucose 6-dehydrogenase
MGSDSRIGYAFLYPGCGYGGSCFPTDVRALIGTARERRYEPELLDAIEAVNGRQKRVMADKVLKRYGERLEGLVLAVWGLAFKPGTDDMRESPAVSVITRLAGHGAGIRAYDPKAMENAARYLGGRSITYCGDKYEALEGADALLLLTEWSEFRRPDFEKMRGLLREPVLFDGRNQYGPDEIRRAGFEYHACGRPAPEAR